MRLSSIKSVALRKMVRLVEPEWGSIGGEEPLSAEAVEQRAAELLARMTLKEKTGQLSGDLPLIRGGLWMARDYNGEPIPGGENVRLGIPGIRFTDGPRGVSIYRSTCFPVAMARGASWDLELEERIGDAIGVEARTQGANFFGGVCLNLLRHPAWGRAQETFGEDPFHVGAMGAALVRGVQRHLMACIKHFVCNSIEKSRFTVDVRIDDRALREVYLRQFKRCVDAGAAAVMSAYNKVNGEYCSHSRRLLTDILRTEWGFDGLVMSDFVYAVHGPDAVTAGLDLEMPFARHFGRKLRRRVRRGRIPESAVDVAVLRVLRQKLRFSRIGEPERYREEAVAGPVHRLLARESAEKSAVLLRNERVGETPALPLDLRDLRTLAVLGSLADSPNTGDLGSSRVRPPYTVSPLAGIRGAAPRLDVRHHDGTDVAAAVEAARVSDAAVVVVGYTPEDEGEYITGVPLVARGKSGDRDSLRLRPSDEHLIGAVAEANPRTVVVMFAGSAVVTELWLHRVSAVLVMWYAGMEGGAALARLLFGDANPGGKLPCVFPKSDAQLPFFDPRADEIEYGMYHGYTLLDRAGEEPAYAFGYGLSYTSFVIENLEVAPEAVTTNATLRVAVDLRNSGERAGGEVVQVYAGCESSRYDRPFVKLAGFAKVYLDAGEGRRVAVEISVADLAVWDGRWVVEPGFYRLRVGNWSRDPNALEGRFEIQEGAACET